MAEIMDKHYVEHRGGMEQIYRYLYSKLTPGSTIDIEFEDGKVSMFHFSEEGDKLGLNWKPTEEKIDSLLNISGLDRKSLSWLRNKLEKNGCISISMKAIPEDSYCIGFRRVGLGKYSYIIYHTPLSTEEQNKINESESSIVYSPLVVFHYGGGAFGSQNFPREEEYLFKQSRIPKEVGQ